MEYVLYCFLFRVLLIPSPTEHYIIITLIIICQIIISQILYLKGEYLIFRQDVQGRLIANDCSFVPKRGGAMLKRFFFSRSAVQMFRYKTKVVSVI